MPIYYYRGRDNKGELRTGQLFAENLDQINNELSRAGIIPVEIKPFYQEVSFKDISSWFRSRRLLNEELVIFARQMHLLHKSGVSIVLSIKQLAAYTRSPQLAAALHGVVEEIEKGQNLTTALKKFPDVFSPLMINLVQIGENTGHLSDIFLQIYQYLEFEVSNAKQLKTALRYPLYVLISITAAIIILNIFVIPSFANFYARLGVELPWQTRILLLISNTLVHQGIFILIALMMIGYSLIRYIRTEKGSYRWHRFQLKIPIVGKLLKRIMLIRFSQSLAIILNSGLSLIKGLELVTDILKNSYFNQQIISMKEAIEHGNTFTQAIKNNDLFSSLEQQILAVGEKSGELGPALNFIADFHSHEIEYDLKKLGDLIGPIVLTFVSILVLIMALGIYLPIWNMISLIH